MTIVLITLAVVLYIAGIFVAFRLLKQSSNTTFERWWFSFFWPLEAILYVLYLVHKKF